MAEIDPMRVGNDSPLSEEELDGQPRGEVKGEPAAAKGGVAGNPEVPTTGLRADSHHIAHAGSKAGEREDEDNVEDSGGDDKPDAPRMNPVADEANPPGAPDQRRHVA